MSFRLDFLRHLTVDPKVVIDAAAFEGRNSLSFKRCFPYARVIATEACNDNFAMLRHHCGGTTGVEMIQAAICGQTGVVDYWQSYSAQGDAANGSTRQPSSALRNAIPHWQFKDAVPMRAYTIQSLCEQMHISHVDVLLINMLGADGDIINGLGPIRPNMIYIRTMPEDYYYAGAMPREAVRALLVSLGYEIRWQEPHCDLFVLKVQNTVKIIKRAPVAQPLLSILTPSIPSRLPVLASLLNKVECQIGDLPIEHLTLLDHKSMSIGMKRDILLHSARGKFVSYVDDDDDLSDNYCSELIKAIQEYPDVDCVVFNQTCYLDENLPFTVRFGLEYQNEQARINRQNGRYVDIKRKPWTCCAWNAKLAKRFHYPDDGFSEDFDYCKQLWVEAKTQHRIDLPLHIYRFNSITSEGPQTIASREGAKNDI